MTSPSASLDMNHIPVQSESELQTQPSPVLMTTSHDLTLNETSTSITIDASHPNPTPPMTPPPPPPAILPISLPNSPTLLPSPSISPSCSFGHNVLPSSSPLSSPPASSSPHRSRTLTLSDSHRSRSRSLSRGISAIESPPRSVYASFNDQDAGTDADASAEQSFSGSSSGLHSLQSSPRSAVGFERSRARGRTRTMSGHSSLAEPVFAKPEVVFARAVRVHTEGKDAQSALQGDEASGIPNPADGPISGLKKSNVHFQSQKAQPPKPKATIKPGLPPRIPSQPLRVPSAAPHPPPVQQKFQHQEEDPNRTQNVYINGLPAHLPEAELFELASPFGAVRSVRCFTRHVGERASGYGFVLFESVDSAERCINKLRESRNLHPSFSKQVHKIPAARSGRMSEVVLGGPDAAGMEGSFRARMEQLKDENSTNLYFEGLPMSIDEPTLAALVSPFQIKSSRFFQTKLSDPPRIIAFVRLETHEAAEEIIDRLHGRMVRGWNEPGCRISVRFADTSEQRDMRRTERTTREEEPSPNRMTIAQAALLNLRGQGFPQVQPINLHPHPHQLASAHDDFKVIPRGVDRYYSSHPDVLSSNAAYSPGFSPQFQTHGLPASRGFNPGMTNMTESMQAGQTLNEGYAHGYPRTDEYVTHAQAAALATFPFHPHAPPHGQMAAAPQGQSGFTPVEERILHAHASVGQTPSSNQRRSPLPGPRGGMSSVRQDSRQLASLHPDARMFSPVAPTDMLTPISEHDFHANAQGHLQPSSQQRPCHYRTEMPGNDGMVRQDNYNRASAPSEIPYSHHDDRVPHALYDSQLSYQNSKQAHLRSTTAPSSQFNQRPYRSQQHHSTISFPPSNIGTNISNIRSNNYINTGNQLHQEHSKHTNSNHASHHAISHRTQHNGNYDSAHFNNNLHTIQDGSEHDESPLVSPSLTYSSRTPSTLSPATPFFGSFTHAQESFKGQDDYEGLVGGPQVSEKGRV